MTRAPIAAARAAAAADYPTRLEAYYAFSASSALPVEPLADFVRYAKARPGELNYGRVGAGSVTELLAKQFEKLAGIRHIVAAIATNEYRSVIEKLGVIPVSSTPGEFGRVMTDTVKEAAEMFRELGIERIE